MASRLRRDPRCGRVWYPPAKLEIPRAVRRAELVDRAYGEGGPKHGVRRRRDAIDTLWRGYQYLRVRASRECSADFATTAEQTIVGLSYELSRRGAKAWDPTLGEGLEGKERRELLLHHRGRALAKLLDELAAMRLLVWGGERDNNGLWWRLRIRLLDPDGPPPDRERWMRRLAALERGDPRGRGARSREEVESERSPPATTAGGTVNLAGLYERVEALTGHRPALATAQVMQLRTAARRFARHAELRPNGVSTDPVEVLLAQIEHHARDAASALSWVLPRFDALTRRMEAASKAPAAGRSSRNCAALSNRLTSDVPSPSTSACTTGAGAPVESGDVGVAATAAEGSGNAQTAITEDGRDRAWAATLDALLERVAARERRLEALSGPRRAAQAEALLRARSWPEERPLPVALATAAVEAIDGHRPWLSERQVERLRRAERRYQRYADRRPAGAPAAAAAVLITLVSERPAHVAAGLPWAIAQLDLLSKRMRRDGRRARESGAAARGRARRRRERTAARAGAFYARQAGRHRQLVDTALEHLVAGLLGRRERGETSAAWRALEEELRLVQHLPSADQLELAKQGEIHGRAVSDCELNGLRWRAFEEPGVSVDELPVLVRALAAVGVARTVEQLRRELRDRLLLSGAPAATIEQLKRRDPELACTPARYDPTGPQLAECDRSRLLERPVVARRQALERAAVTLG